MKAVNDVIRVQAVRVPLKLLPTGNNTF